MPNWSDPESIKAWLKANPDNGKAESKAKAEARQAKEMGPKDRPTPDILKPLVTGKPVERPSTYGGWNEVDANRNPQTGRRRQEPQAAPQRDRNVAPGTPVGGRAEPDMEISAWRRQNAVPSGTASPVAIPGFGVLPGYVADAAARQTAESQARAARDKSIDFDTWRKVGVQQSGIGPALKGDMFDWVGLGDLPAAKYADAQSYAQQTDDKPEQFPGQDWANNVLNQWNAGTYAVTTQPFIPATPGDKKALGIPEKEDARFSVAELGSYAGQILNQTFNPFNPNRNLGAGKENEKKAQEQMRENYEFRSAIDDLPPEKRDAAWLIWTGTAQSNKSSKAWEEWSTLPQKQQQTQQQMDAALARGDTQAANQLGQQLEQLKNTNMWSIIEDNQNPWAEMIYGSLVDPVDWATGGATKILGATPALAKSAAAARKFNIAPDVATRQIEEAMKAAEPIVKKIAGGEGLENWFQKLNPFERTASTKAYLDARELYETAMVLTTGITNKVDAKKVITNWVETGGVDLVNGLGLQKPVEGMLSADNTLRVGAGVLGNKDVLKALPILQASKDDLLNMKALQGVGEYKPTEMLAELAKIVSTTANKAYDANKPRGPLMTIATAPSNILRGVLSTMYLNLRPANWVRQATSQAANLAADESFSLRPLKSLIDDVVAKNGNLPLDMRLNEPEKMFGEVTSQKTLAEMFGLGKNSGLAKIERAGAGVWGGDTTILGTVPVGENAFYANAYATTFQRTFKEFWTSAVQKQYVGALANMGMEPELANDIARAVIDAGVMGGKGDVATKLRTFVASKKWVPEVPIPEESMLLEHRKELQDILGQFTPDNLQEAQKALGDLFRRASAGAAQVLAQAPPSVTPTMTSAGSAADAKQILANVVDVLQRTGAGKESIDQAKAIAGAVLQAEAQHYGQFVKDLAQAGDPSALNYAFDVWGRALDLKNKYRQQADAINRNALKAIDSGADRTQSWQQAYQGITENWQKYGEEFGTLMEGARGELLNGTYAPSFDWGNVVKKYMAYDTDAIEQARQIVPMGTVQDADAYAKVIDANRQFLDHATTELFSVYKAMPTVDSFDIIGGVMRQAEAYGAQAWMEVRKLKDEALGNKRTWTSFYEESSAVWRKAFEHSEESMQAAKRSIVWNYVVNETPSKLKWNDAFAGEYQLLGPSKKPGIWLAKDDKGKTVMLAEEGFDAGKVKKMGVAEADATWTKQGKNLKQAKAAAEPYESGGSGLYVPKDIIADYNRIVNGNVEDTVDELLDAIPNAVTERPVAQAAEEVLTPKVNDIPVKTPNAGSTADLTVDMPQGGDDFLETGQRFVDKVKAYYDERKTATTAAQEASVPLGTPPVAATAPVGTAAQRSARVRDMASIVGINTATKDGRPFDSALMRSINSHVADIGLDGKVRKLDDLSAEDADKVIAYYRKRAEKMGKQTSLKEFTDRWAVKGMGDPGKPVEMHGGLGAVGLPNWMVPKWKRGDLWKAPEQAGKWFPDGDAYESVKQGIMLARSKNAQPQVGDMALEQLKAIDQVQKYVMENLPQLLAGKANTLTPAQQLQVLDLAGKVLTPAYDNVLRASAESAKKMANFAMMDFNDRRDIDTLVSLVMPFHYYWSRSAGNWMQRVAAKPALLDFWLESQRAVAIENAQPEMVDGVPVDKPQRLMGTVPNPLKEVVNADWMPDRLQNPTTWGLPFEMYLGYNRADEPDTESQVVKWQSNVASYFAEKTFPWYQMAAAAQMDKMWPLPEGERSRMDQFKDSQQLADYAPLWRMAGYGGQAMGWLGQPSGGLGSFGDEWDAYLIGRQARNAVQAGNMDPNTAKLVQQMALNKDQGKELSTDIPPEYLESVQAEYDKMVQAAGGEKFARNAFGYMTGFTNQFYPEQEKEFQAGANNYYNSGYGPENLGGSKAARDAALEATPALEVQWNQKALIPGAEGVTSPADSAATSQLYDQGAALTEERDKAMSAAGEKVALAGGTNKEIYAARNAVYDEYKPKIDAIYSQIEGTKPQSPSVAGAAVAAGTAASQTEAGGTAYTPKAARTPEQVAAGTFPKGMNPQEFKDAQAQDVFGSLSSKFPFLPDGTPYAEVAKQNEAKEAYAIGELVKLGMTEEQAKQAYETNKTKNLSPIEKAAIQRNREAQEAANAANDAMWAQRGDWITQAYGEEATVTWTSYYALPKGSQARKDYMAEHPEMRAYNLAAYNQEGYSYLAGRYGSDTVMAWAKAPKWSEDKAQQATREAYMEANPKVWFVNSWVNGRPEPFDPDSKPEFNYGQDWSEAERVFGGDIWDRVERYKQATGGEKKALFKSLELKDWNDWWYGLLPEQEKRSILPAYVFKGGGGRAFGGGGRGGGGSGYGGGSGGGGGDYTPRIYPQQVDPQYMDRDLEVSAQNIRPWRRPEQNDDWMYAGRQLTPNRKDYSSWR